MEKLIKKYIENNLHDGIKNLHISKGAFHSTVIYVSYEYGEIYKEKDVEISIWEVLNWVYKYYG